MNEDNRYNELKDFCDSLWHAWRRHPDLRLGQLIVNAFSHKFSPTFSLSQDIFFCKDEDLLNAISRFSEKLYTEQNTEKNP